MVPGVGCRCDFRCGCSALRQEYLPILYQKATRKSRSCPSGHTFNMPAFPFLHLHMHSAFPCDYGPERMHLNKKPDGTDVGFIPLLWLSIRFKENHILRIHGLKDPVREGTQGPLGKKPTIEEQSLVGQALSTLKEFCALWAAQP